MIAYLSKIHSVTKKFSLVVGSYPKTFFFLLKRKIFGKAQTNAQYKNVPFCFRYKDMSAIDETLIRGEYDFIAPVIKSIPNPIIVDIGMNVGDFAIFVISNNPQSQIIGIEAHPETARIAMRNAALNPAISWDTLNRAAWKDNSMIHLQTSGASVSTKGSTSGEIVVQGIDMKELFSLISSPVVDIMKIDIEGAEEEFLCSFPDSLSNIRHLIVEIHPLSCNETRIREVLERYFSVVEDISGRISSKPLLYCRNSDQHAA